MSFPNTLLDRRCQPAFTAPNRTLPESVYSQIRTNYIPSAIEMVQISQRLSEAQADLTRYDEEILKLRPFVVGPVEKELFAITGQVEQERSALRIYVDGYRCLQAPIRTLPTEILAEIFLWCKPDWMSGSDVISKPKGQTPFRIGLVCTRWRTVVLSLENVWSSIYLALQDTNVYTTSVVKTYLTRSGNQPLSITVSDEGSRHHSYPEALIILIRESYRWRRAAINLPFPVFRELTRAFIRLQNNLPLLEELEIAAIVSETRCFISCPNLRSLKLYGLQPPVRLEFPRVQITDLTVRNGESMDTLTCVSRHLNLQHLTVGGHFIRSPGTDSDPTTALPVTHNLAALTLQLPVHYIDVVEGMTDLLENLILPRLTSLEVQAHPQTIRGWELKLLTDFLQRSSCALDTLALKCTTMEEVELAELLTLTPTLKTLKLDRCWHEKDRQPLMGTFAETLTISRATNPDSTEISPVLVPQLTHLDLVVANPYIDEISIAEMVESRRPRVVSPALSDSIPSLERVTITFLNRTRALHPNLRRRMVALSLGGLEVTLLE